MNKQLFLLSLIINIASHSTFTKAVELQQYSNYETKKQRWDEMARQVETWTDGLGMPIDAGIKDTIIVLNLLGFKTEQSCEGHVDWGTRYPWVRFASMMSDADIQEYEPIRQKSEELEHKVYAAENVIIAAYPELSKWEALHFKATDELIALYAARNAASDKCMQYIKQSYVAINDLLMMFYKDGGAHPDRMIQWKHDEISSVGGYWQDIRDDATKAAKLKEYQDEMRQFTDFLIDVYYSK